jgi:hypothetical protein
MIHDLFDITVIITKDRAANDSFIGKLGEATTTTVNTTNHTNLPDNNNRNNNGSLLLTSCVASFCRVFQNVRLIFVHRYITTSI